MAHSRASKTEATTFCLCFSYISIFFYWTAAVLPQEQPKLSQQTELSLPPHTTTLPTTTGSGKYNLVVSFHVLCIFYKCFIAMLHFFNSLSMVIPWEGPKLSPQTEFGLLSRTTALPTTAGSGVNIFSVSAYFLHHILSIFLATTNYFQFIILMVLPRE